MKNTTAIEIPAISVDNHGIARTLYDEEGNYLHMLHYSEEIFFLAHHMLTLSKNPLTQIRHGMYDRTLDEGEFAFFTKKYKHVIGRLKKNPPGVEDLLDEALEELESPFAHFWSHQLPNSELIVHFNALCQVAFHMICYQRSLALVKANS